jgi:hypothetical protein
MAQKGKLTRTFWAPLKSQSSEKEAGFEDLVEMERFRTRPYMFSRSEAGLKRKESEGSVSVLGLNEG